MSTSCWETSYILPINGRWCCISLWIVGLKNLSGAVMLILRKFIWLHGKLFVFPGKRVVWTWNLPVLLMILSFCTLVGSLWLKSLNGLQCLWNSIFLLANQLSVIYRPRFGLALKPKLALLLIIVYGWLAPVILSIFGTIVGLGFLW